MTSSPIVIFPAVGISSRFRQRRSVDFPDPDEPRIEMTSPWRAVKEIPLSTCSSLYLFCSPETERAMGWAGLVFGMGLLLGDGWLDPGFRGGDSFEKGDQVFNGEVQRQVDSASDDEHFQRAEGLGDQARCDASDFHHRDDRAQGCGF